LKHKVINKNFKLSHPIKASIMQCVKQFVLLYFISNSVIRNPSEFELYCY